MWPFNSRRQGHESSDETRLDSAMKLSQEILSAVWFSECFFIVLFALCFCFLRAIAVDSEAVLAQSFVVLIINHMRTLMTLLHSTAMFTRILITSCELYHASTHIYALLINFHYVVSDQNIFS